MITLDAHDILMCSRPRLASSVLRSARPTLAQQDTPYSVDQASDEALLNELGKHTMRAACGVYLERRDSSSASSIPIPIKIQLKVAVSEPT